ncbi:hypothetical protein BSKO_02719 [Bryopsis sp. KO-2023]|nr:hypothetical protein BSKO_02719 [Bryopsis sp. KO-2023]
MVFRELERRTGQRIFDLFNLIGGTSTGAMLACEIGLVNFSMNQCGKTYKTLGGKVFSQAETEDQSSWKESFEFCTVPAAVAVQQGSLLWPGTPIDCVVSVGVGVTPVAKWEKSSTSFIENGSVLLESACNVERVDEVLSTVLPMVPGMKYFRFCASDNRCDMASNNVDPEAWEKLEAVTGDYLESVSDSLDEAAAILLSGIDTSRVHRSTPKEVRLGPRKGLVVVDCPTPGCKWGKDVAMLCSALEHTVLRVILRACVETDSVGENGYVGAGQIALDLVMYFEWLKGGESSRTERQGMGI